MILLPRKILAVTTNLAMFSSKTTIFTVGFQPQQLHGASRHLFTKSSKRLNWLLQEMTSMPIGNMTIMTYLHAYYHQMLQYILQT